MKKIQKYLSKIESDMDVDIMLACETGSRAWGFPSPDSDYDIRIIYKHKKDWYLSLSEGKDSIDLMFENNDIDITGWDIRKSLRLMWKSNASLIERLQSPIIYKADTEFLNEMNVLASETYSRIATLHHYLSMAKKCFSEISDLKEYKLKKFFYALRSAVACLWILEKDEKPPIVFTNMLEGLEIDSVLKQRISELIALKATISETYLHTDESALFQFIQSIISRADDEGKHLPGAKGDIEKMNAFFRKTLDK